jgi:hypothetical protein
MNTYVSIMKNKIRTSLFYVFCIGVLSFCHSSSLSDYKGTPYADIMYHEGPQTIPGKLQCEYYDIGGEGVSFHDADTINSSSGRLNPADGSYLHEFRINEADRQDLVKITIYSLRHSGWVRPSIPYQCYRQ